MAIVQNRKSLLDTSLIQGDENQDKSQNSNNTADQKNINTKSKPKGLIATTLDEISKVEWPSINYVLRWSLIIIVFTFIFAIVLGIFDHLFSSGIRFIDCSSPQSKNRGLNQCATELLQDITFANQA